MTSSTDCRTDEGVTVGLIDTIITACRVLKGRDLRSEPVRQAFQDLAADPDFASIQTEIVLAGVTSRGRRPKG